MRRKNNNLMTNITRNILAFTQGVIDLIIYWLSFSLAMSLWLSGIPAVFAFEIRAFFAGTMLAVFFFNSLYSFQNWIFWDEIKAVLKSTALIVLVIVLYLYSQKFDLSRFMITSGILIFVPLCLLARYVFRRIFFALGLLTTNIIILGAGRTGEIFAEKIIAHPFTSCKVVGFLDDDPEKQGKIIAGFPVLGTLDDFMKVYGEYRIDEAASAISTASRSLLTHILDIVEFHVRQVHYIPDMYMLTTFSASMHDVDGLPVISASQGLLNPINRAVKSTFDYVGAVFAIVIFSPVMLWVSWKIKRTDGGEAVTVQERMGCKFRAFNAYKFRLVRRYGALLRNTGIYELPMLFNVLKGEMSLVGPRPLMPKEIENCDDVMRKIYTVKPGISGFWQVSGRSNIDMELRGEMTLYYIRNWSLWLDIVILLRTLYVMISKMITKPGRTN